MHDKTCNDAVLTPKTICGYSSKVQEATKKHLWWKPIDQEAAAKMKSGKSYWRTSYSFMIDIEMCDLVGSISWKLKWIQ